MTPALLLEEAQARLLELATPLPTEPAAVMDAIGRYLAEPLIARRTQPAADLSAMDGYAVAANDRAGPWRVVGESAAGHPFGGVIAPGSTVRISTGAPMPAGGGAVVLQENAARDGDHVALIAPATAEERHVRCRGLDFIEGTHLLAPGTRVDAPQVGLAIAAGHETLAVRRRARIAIFDTGDELAREPRPTASHRIPASNAAMVAAMIAPIPAEVHRLAPVPDDLDVLTAAFARCEDVDVIVSSGGASVGDHDLIAPALDRWGATTAFWRVAIRPGKPLLVATRKRASASQIILGLPGNPGSSLVTAYLFLLPLLRAMSGSAAPLPLAITARLATALPPGGSRREFLRATWDGETVRAHALQDSGVLGALAASNALIDRPAQATAAMPGETVRVYMLANGGNA